MPIPTQPISFPDAAFGKSDHRSQLDFKLRRSIDAAKVNGEVYNVGSPSCLAQLKPLADLIAKKVPRDVEIEWYGDADTRSYQTSFQKIEALGFSCEKSIEGGIEEICMALEKGTIDRTPQSINQDWYQTLESYHKIIKDLTMHGGIMQIENE